MTEPKPGDVARPPVEMWAGVSNKTGEIVGSAWDIPRNTVPCRIRGLFVPLERIES